MGLIDKVRGYLNKENNSTVIKLVEERGNGFYTWNGNLYKSDVVQSCIRPKVHAVGKLMAQHLRDDKVNNTFKINPDAYMRFLLDEPNQFSCGQVFQERMAIQLALNNNAFALIVKDDNGVPVQLYNIPCVGAEAIYDSDGTLYIKFTNRNGKILTFPYTDIIHLRENYGENDVFGTSPWEQLKPLMEIVSTCDQGIVNAIKNSAIIRWLLKFNANLRPEDVKQKTQEFVEQFLDVSNGSGAAGVDAKCDAQQIEPKDYVPNAAQTDRTMERIYSSFNTNKKIVQSNYNEDEWNAYYESEIEPLAIQMSNEYTRKLFNRRERGFGNKIIFAANNLQYASMNTKLGLQAMVDRGAMTPNEWRQVLNLPPVVDGDKPLRRLDTAVVEGGENK